MRLPLWWELVVAFGYSGRADDPCSIPDAAAAAESAEVKSLYAGGSTKEVLSYMRVAALALDIYVATYCLEQNGVHLLVACCCSCVPGKGAV